MKFLFSMTSVERKIKKKWYQEGKREKTKADDDKCWGVWKGNDKLEAADWFPSDNFFGYSWNFLWNFFIVILFCNKKIFWILQKFSIHHKKKLINLSKNISPTSSHHRKLSDHKTPFIFIIYIFCICLPCSITSSS